MYSSNFRKYLTATVAGFGVFSFGSLVMPNTANAFSVGYGSTFDSGFADWNTSGDTDIRGTLTGTYNGDSRSYNTGTGSQAVLTTACSNTAYTPNPNLSYQNTECFDTQDDTQPRNDDPNADAGRFNYSGNDQTDANAENSGTSEEALAITNVQEFLGLSADALNIPLQDGDTNLGDERTPKEGSAIKLNDTIVADGPFTISFNWTYLTNDGQDFFLGDSDYAFVTIYDENSDINSRSPIVLADSDNPNIPPITNDDTAYALETSGIYTSDVLPSGNYVVGFGVVDVGGVNRSSALLLDDFQTTSAAVPFEFSPTTGIGLVAGFIGLARLRRRFQ